MGEFGRGGPGPLPNEPMTWIHKQRQRESRDEAELEHEVKAAHGVERHRRRWWPFGRRRTQ